MGLVPPLLGCWGRLQPPYPTLCQRGLLLLKIIVFACLVLVLAGIGMWLRPSPALVQFSEGPTVCHGFLEFEGKTTGNAYLRPHGDLPFMVNRGDGAGAFAILGRGDATADGDGRHAPLYRVTSDTFRIAVDWPDDYRREDDYHLVVWGMGDKYETTRQEEVVLRAAEIEYCND